MIKQIINLAINRENITIHDLHMLGFINYDINNLIKDKIIEPAGNDLFKFIDYKMIYNLGKELFKEDYSKSEKYFEYCINHNCKVYSSYYRLLVSSVYNKNYQRAFNIIDVLISMNSNTKSKYEMEYNTANLNFYLYMLSLITEIPDKYNNLLDGININDMTFDLKLDESSNELNLLRNKIRCYAINKNFPEAQKYQDILNGKELKDLLTDILITQYKDKCINNTYTLYSLLRDKKYVEYINFINKEKANGKLSHSKEYKEKIIFDLLEIQETDEIPIIKSFVADTRYDAIDNKNYGLALGNSKKCKSLSKELKDICKLIDFVISCKKEDKLSLNEIYNFIIINSVNHNHEEVSSFIDRYLARLNKEELSCLILKIKQYDLIINDKTMKNTLECLNCITLNQNISVVPFLKDYFIAISSNDIIKAKLLYSILEEFEKLNLSENNTSYCKEMLPSVSISDDNIYTDYAVPQVNKLEFNNDLDNYYGISNFNEISLYILSSGLDVESACSELMLSNEETNIIRLIFAKEYYAKKYYEIGDKFVKCVEQSDKTDKVIKILNEIRTNKMFYFNREQSNSLNLSLKLSPKKNTKVD